MLLIFNPFQSRIPPRVGLPVPPHGPNPGRGHACFAAAGTDIDGWRVTFEKAGVPVEAEFAWPNGARSLYVRDPAGNSIEFAEPFLWDPSA